MTKMGSIIGHRIDYNVVARGLRGQRNVPSAKNYPSTLGPWNRVYQKFAMVRIVVKVKQLKANCVKS